MKNLFRLSLIAAVAISAFATVCVGVGSAHTVSRTADRLTNNYVNPPGHCQRRSISLRESSISPMQLFGYQAYRFPNCSTSIVAGMVWGLPTKNEALIKLYKWTGSGPYGGFSICRNITQQFSLVTSQVSNKFFNYTNAPCGAGMYAASICTPLGQVVGTYLNPSDVNSFHYTGDEANDCTTQPYTQWVWTNDWHYFA